MKLIAAFLAPMKAHATLASTLLIAVTLTFWGTSALARQAYQDAVFGECGTTIQCNTCHNNNSMRDAALAGNWGYFCPQPTTETNCTDGIDNDGDRRIDCDDQDCGADEACLPPVIEDCTNGVDDNGNGFVDCADADCVGASPCQAQPEPEVCDDRQDNDLDGYIDCNDQDCVEDPACAVVQPEPYCGDGTVDSGEECDDGNNVSGDGCDANCAIETPAPDPGPTPSGSVEEESDDESEYRSYNRRGESSYSRSSDDGGDSERSRRGRSGRRDRR